MTRYKVTLKGIVQSTPEEEAEWDAVESEWVTGTDDRTVDKTRTVQRAKLSSSDWTQVLDALVNRTAWATYRQALRHSKSRRISKRYSLLRYSRIGWLMIRLIIYICSFG